MQTDATLSDVTCCVRLHTLLRVVGCRCVLLRKVWNRSNFQPTTPNISFVPWSPKRSATMLDPFAQLFQHCWGYAPALRVVYNDLWVVSFPRCSAGPNIVGELLRPFARSLKAWNCKLYSKLSLKLRTPFARPCQVEESDGKMMTEINSMRSLNERWQFFV